MCCVINQNVGGFSETIVGVKKGAPKVEFTDGKATLYKVVNKIDEKFFSQIHSTTEYKLGEWLFSSRKSKRVGDWNDDFTDGRVERGIHLFITLENAQTCYKKSLQNEQEVPAILACEVLEEDFIAAGYCHYTYEEYYDSAVFMKVLPKEIVQL